MSSASMTRMFGRLPEPAGRLEGAAVAQAGSVATTGLGPWLVHPASTPSSRSTATVTAARGRNDNCGPFQMRTPPSEQKFGGKDNEAGSAPPAAPSGGPRGGRDLCCHVLEVVADQ